MQLQPPRPPSTPAGDVAAALRAAAATLGQRPAVTVLSPRGREEQGVASLAQWAAKGAHLLELDLLLEPGDRLLLDTPPSWTTAAVCLAAWWAGIEVVLPPLGDREVAVAVLHESRPVPAAVTDVLWLGDAIDGAPLTPEPGREAWASAVQTFPDQPPPPCAAGELLALVAGAERLTQADLLAAAARMGDGVVGLEEARVAPMTATIAIAVHPIVALRPTVVLRGVDRSTADGDRVTTWL